MRAVIILAAFAAFAGPAVAQNGGDRMPAGGAFMSSYSRGAYSNPVRAGDAGQPGLGAAADREVPATGSIERRAPRRTR